MSKESGIWQNTTHDWAMDVDVDHLELIRTDPSFDAYKTALHLILEVLAYPADEALDRGTGAAIVSLHPDGSISVSDNGRGTDTRTDGHGRMIKKPIMATKDLRFFESPDSPPLPDGLARRGMSVVASLSDWLIHSNRRTNGSWTQRYELGLPTTGLTPLHDDGTTGTTVHFLPSQRLLGEGEISVTGLQRLSRDFAPVLTVEIQDHRH
ncbi:ATP-binding protein [Arthrobacter psychrolactophilus]|uniref:ATP-binding protein n=1 Tax=Arthrobacter psychrolactophilus TaxID=92442 RepID=UPI001C650F0F|nr:ATP-binding protein [Arthrobacter psychrolactophilus]